MNIHTKTKKSKNINKHTDKVVDNDDNKIDNKVEINNNKIENIDISENKIATMLKHNIDELFKNIPKKSSIQENSNNNTKNINSNYHTIFNDPLIKNIKINFIFYLSILISIYFICKEENKSLLIGISSFIFVSMSGYFVHFISHFTNYTKIFDTLDNYITRNKFTAYFIRKTCKLVDFHDEIHHDTSVNKTFKNIIMEFGLNFATQAGGLLTLMYFSRQMSYWVVALWGLLYSTIHIINYEFVKPKSHMFHHVNKHTNYGLDIWDVIFNTKYKGNNHDTENINHGAINVILLTGIIIYVMKKMKQNKEIWKRLI